MPFERIVEDVKLPYEVQERSCVEGPIQQGSIMLSPGNLDTLGLILGYIHTCYFILRKLRSCAKSQVVG